jgi:hypothetical protein
VGLGETLYDVGVMASGWSETTAGPRWQVPRFGWDEQVGAADAPAHAELVTA